MYLETTLLAYIIDKIFGEPPFKHPVVYIGELVTFFEKHFYRDSILRGLWLFSFVIGVVFCVVFLTETLFSFLPYWLEIIAGGIIGSMFIAHRMLADAVLGVVNSDDLALKREKIAMLVSRDTGALREEEINKAAIETFAENLSDGVVAPLFYLLFFGLTGLVLYKTINTLDSMVGYRNERYERFGKVSARVDDIANYIPSKITAILILATSFIFWKTRESFVQARGHESPNAGYPISAMANALGVRLGGATSYFGKIKNKPYFGGGTKPLSKETVLEAVMVGERLFLAICLLFGFAISLFKIFA